MIKFIIYAIILAVIYRLLIAKPVVTNKPYYRSKTDNMPRRQHDEDYTDYEEVKE